MGDPIVGRVDEGLVGRKEDEEEEVGGTTEVEDEEAGLSGNEKGFDAVDVDDE